MSGALPKNTDFTRDEWAAAFAPEANRRVRDWIIGWTLHEYGGFEATNATCAFNLLNTHLGNGPKCYADAGKVSAYASLQEGAQANRSVLKENLPGYQTLDRAISSNNIDGLNSGIADQALRTWVGTPVNYGTLGLSRTFEVEGRGARNQVLAAKPASGGGGGTDTTPIGPLSSGCKSPDDGSCRSCRGGTPGQCPTDEQCVIFNSDGSTIPAPFSAIPNGVCVTNAYASQHTPASVSNPLGSIFNISIAGWDAVRIAKWIAGLALMGFGLLLLFVIVTGKLEKNPLVKGATRAAALAGG